MAINHPVVITSTAAQAAGSILEQVDVTGILIPDLATGVITFTDADVIDVHVATVAPTATGYLGTLKAALLTDSTGGVTGSVGWTFSVPDQALDFLAAGQTLVQTYTVTISDFQGVASRATQLVTVTITGTNDVPVIAGVSSGAVTEDVGVVAGNLATGGTLTIVDGDLGQSSFVAQAATAGSSGLGTFTLNAAGHWTYAANDAQAGIQQLSLGQSVTDSFTASSLDGTKTQLVTVTIRGNNDLAVMTSTTAQVNGSIVERAGATGSLAADTVSGAINFTDDLNDKHLVVGVVQHGPGYLGSFTLSALSESTGGVTGSVPWTFSVKDGALDVLAAGQTVVQSYDVTLSDLHGPTAFVTQTVTVTLIGTNDVPVIAGVSTGALTEDVAVAAGNLATGGALTIADADLGQSSFVAQAGTAGSSGLGSFTLDTAGHWTYAASNAQLAIQQLGAGQSATDSFTASSLDGSKTQLVTVTITGTNDVPVIGGVSSGAVTEDVGVVAGNLATGGTLTIADADLGQSSFVAQAATASAHGAFTLDTAGNWTYAANDAQAAIQQLGAGQTLTDSFTATSLDGTKTQLVTVTITGTNDVPVIAGVSSGAVTEDVGVVAGNLATGGTLTIVDGDLGQSSFVAQAATAGSSGLGTFTLNAAGHWTYAANDAQAGIQQLSLGQSVTDSFTASSLDGTKTQLVTVTIRGNNDLAVMTSTTAQVNGSIVERAGATGSLAADTVSGAINFTDDLNDKHLVVGVVQHGPGYLGSFTLSALSESTGGVTGSVPWTFSVKDGALDVLAAGQTVVQSYDVTLSDLHGPTAFVTQTVTVTLIGTNDVPVIAGVSTGALTEDVAVAAGNLATGGALTIADADLGQSSFVAQAGTAGSSGLGSFTLDTAGHWTYAASNAQLAIQQLGAGQSATDSFTASSLDGSKTQLVTVTINGTNDVPVIVGASSGAVTEDVGVVAGNLATGGTLTIVDADLGQSSFVAQAATASAHGAFTLDTAGNWTYTANDAQAAIQQLGAGQTLTDSFTASSLDGTKTQLVTVTITGTNDVPVIGGVSSGAVTEDVGVVAGNLATGGTLTIVDGDLGQSSFVAQAATAGSSGLGTFTLNAAGHWTYAANDAQAGIEQLSLGQSVTDSFTASSLDGTKTQLVTVTIRGTNDLAVMTSTTAQVNGSIVERAGATGSLAADTVSGAINFTDDLNDKHLVVGVVQHGTGYLGSFTLSALSDSTGGVTGSVPWTFSVKDGALDFLAAGQTVVQSYDVTLSDLHGPTAFVTQTVTVTLIGTNDVPVIAGVSTGALTEDVAVAAGNLATGGALTIADADLGQSSFVAQAGTAGSSGLGSFTLDTAGHWTYAASNAQLAIQQLGAGQSATDSFTASSLDGSKTQLVTVTINGTNDVPVIGGVHTGTVTEDVAVVAGTLATGGSLTIADVDLGQSSFVAQAATAGSSGLGTFSLDAAGHWTYAASNAQAAIQQLGAGESVTDSFTATSLDGSKTQVVTVTINGTNDVPVIGGASTGAVNEDAAVVAGNLATGGALTIADADLGQSSFVAQAATASAHGAFTLDAAGNWTYTADDAQAAIQQLGAGQSLTDSFTATSLDGTKTQLVTVTINGTNDVPVIGGVSTGAVTEDVAVVAGNLATSGALSIADADLGQSTFVAQAATAGAHGTFTLDTAGNWAYTASDAQVAIQQLGAGQTLTDSFTATSLDGTKTQLVTVTINGTNDVPVIGGVSTGAVTEDIGVVTGNLATGGTLTIVDGDLGQSSFVAQAATASAHGAFTLDTAGNWTYTANDAQAAIQQLGAGQTLTDSFTATSLDGTTTQLVTVTINGTNDVPVIGGVGTAAVTEDVGVVAGNLVAGGALTIADIDLGQSSFVAQAATAGAHGTFTLDTAGNWTYTASDGQVAIQQLGAGQTLTDSFTATSLDGSKTQLVTVTINGTNDVPVIGGVSTGAVTEDLGVAAGNLAASGSLTIADADLGQSSFVAQATAAGAHGTFSLDAAGHWTYTASNAQVAIQQLGAGQTLTDSFTAASLDGTKSQLVTVTINGTNDVPVIGGVSTAALAEDVGVVAGALAASGALTIADVDLGQSSFVAQAAVAGSSGLGTFTLDSAGNWTYTASNAQVGIQQLGAGQSATDSFTATSLDGTKTQLVTVTINGTNDVPVIGGVSTGSVTEDVGVVAGNLATSGTLTIADADLGQSSFVAQAAAAGGHGTFALDAAGHWTYAASDAQVAVQQLGVGQTLTDSFTATSLDGTKSQLVTVTINGTNDAPVIAGVTTGTVTELAGIAGGLATDPVSGTLTFKDADLPDTHTVSVVPQAAGYLGTFLLGAGTDSTGGGTGAVPWSFSVADSALDGLAAGQSVVQKYNVTVDDGHGGVTTQAVAVTLTGTNDAPVVTAATANGTVTELAGATGSAVADTATGTISFTDPDLIDTHTASAVALGTGYVGSLGFGPVADSTGGTTGSVGWTFSAPDSALDFLAAGQTVIQSYNVTVADGHGGTAAQTVAVTLIGTNDAPVAQAIQTTANEHGPAVTLAASFTDADLADIHTFSVDTTGTLGTVANNGNGTFGYDPAGQFASLNVGQTATDTFTYTVDDHHGGTATQTATVTIFGQNDAPVANADTVVVNGPSGNLWTTLLANDTDVDTAHSALTITAVNSVGTHGVVSLNVATQSLTFTPATGTDSFSYTISDGQGGSNSATVSVVADHVNTDNWLVTAGQTATFSPAAVLANDSAFDGTAMSLVSVSGPNVALDPITGNIVYTAPPVPGASDSFTYTASDHFGGLATGTVNVSLVDGAATPVGSTANQAEWLVGSGNSPVTFIGSAGADRLIGTNAVDLLNRPVDDVFTGGAGADTITNGIGSDHDIYNYGGAANSNRDSSLAAMDHITDFDHKGAGTGSDVIELNGFNFTAASVATVTNTTVKVGLTFTAADVAGYFSDGNAVHTEKVTTGGGNTATKDVQIYVDANHSGSFEAASDLVIHLDNFANGLTTVDFQFH